MNGPAPQTNRNAPADRPGAPATVGWAAMILAASSFTARAQDAPGAVTTNAVAKVEEQKWNWHVQNTDIVQGDPGTISVFWTCQFHFCSSTLATALVVTAPGASCALAVKLLAASIIAAHPTVAGAPGRSAGALRLVWGAGPFIV